MSDDWLAGEERWDEDTADLDFPIADYDKLTSDEILPLLPQLYPEEYGVVAERERSTKNRREVLLRLAELEAEAATPGATVAPEEAVAGGVTVDAANPVEQVAESVSEPAIVEPDVAAESPEPAAAPPPPPAPVPSAPAPPAVVAGTPNPPPEAPTAVPAPEFPIEDYDDLSVDEIVSVLDELDDDELRDVKAREERGQGRRRIVVAIHRRLGLPPPPVRVHRDEH